MCHYGEGRRHKLETITVQDELDELYREWRMRKRNYPRWQAAGKLTAQAAAHQMACLETTIARLKVLQAQGAPAQLILTDD